MSRNQSINGKHDALRAELLRRLVNMERPAFERLMLDLLRKSGYSNVQLADRMDKRGRTMQGGLDLKAFSETDISQSLTIVQVKQYEYPVPRRFVDEIRSTVRRTGAHQGVIITTSTFGNVARQVAASDPSAPVILIDGNGLLDLLFPKRIGIKEETVHRLTLDDELFRGLP